MIGPVPGFEVAGYDRDVLDAFSTRRRDILEDIGRRGGAYSAARARRPLSTRGGARRSRPCTCWGRHGSGAPGRAAPFREAAARARRSLRARRDAAVRPRLSIHEAAWRAVEYLEERSSVFASGDIAAHALGQAPGRHTVAEVEAAIEGLRRDGHLVQATLRRGRRGPNALVVSDMPSSCSLQTI